MNRDPVAPVRLNPELPSKLEDIIGKSMEKDREMRYQHASDIRTDLKRLKRETETGRPGAASSGTIPVARSQTSEPSSPQTAPSGSSPAVAQRISSGAVAAVEVLRLAEESFENCDSDPVPAVAALLPEAFTPVTSAPRCPRFWQISTTRRGPGL
jgi:serine/threonine protein kinase